MPKKPPRRGPVIPYDERVMSRISPPDPVTGCQDWTGGTARGYATLTMTITPEGEERKQVTQRICRLIVAWSRGLDAGDHSWLALHSCDRPICCSPDHLRPGTQLENARDMVSRGRTGRGRWRLTEEQVAEIRRLRTEGVPRKEVAARYGVHPGHITAICSRRFWK